MKCREVEDLLHGYYAGDLSGPDAHAVEQHLTGCSTCSKRSLELEKIYRLTGDLPGMEPPASLMDFNADIAKNGNRIDIERRREFNLPRRNILLIAAGTAAAVILFFAGFLSGRNLASVRLENEQIAALQEEVRETKNLMIVNMLKQESASRRLMAVNYADNLDLLMPETMDALLHSLNNDKNVNVRLATLGTLARYSYDQQIRTELLKAFEKESEPLIQINMIHLMVLLNEKSSAETLKRLADDVHTTELVREQARKGLSVLL